MYVELAWTRLCVAFVYFMTLSYVCTSKWQQCAHILCIFAIKNMENIKWSREMPINARVAEYRSYVKSIPIHQSLAKRSGEVKWTTEWTARQIEWTVEKSMKFQRSWFSSFPTAVHKWKLHKNTPKLFCLGFLKGRRNKNISFMHLFRYKNLVVEMGIRLDLSANGGNFIILYIW